MDRRLYITSREDGDDATSSFLPPASAEAGATFSDWSVLPSRGFNELVRAKRYGRWWVLKGLKAAYREQSVYRLLLRKEYDLLSQLSHPHVVAAHSIEEVEGLGLCIVMEWIDGVNLARWLAQGGHTRRERLAVARQLMDALAYIHGRQIVHRDLKPSNIMVTANGGTVKLIDFGLADADSYALFKQSAGSAGYLSPEQRAGGKPDVRNDLYSLGCVMADLRLGWAARGVIRRCRRPLAARYPTVAALRRAWDRRRRMPFCLLLVALVLLSLAALALRPRLSPAEPAASPRVTQTADTLEKTAPEKTAPEKTGSEKAAAAETFSDETVIDEAVARGKTLVDERVAPYDRALRQRADTLSRRRYIEAYLQSAFDDVNAFVAAYADSFKPQLHQPSAEQAINGQLLLYANERYYQPWINLLESLPQ